MLGLYFLTFHVMHSVVNVIAMFLWDLVVAAGGRLGLGISAEEDEL